jgi:protein phosphatase
MDPVWIVAVVVALGLVALGLWILARSEPRAEEADASRSEGEVASLGTMTDSVSIAPRSIPPPVDPEGNLVGGSTLGDDLAPATTQATLSSELDIDLGSPHMEEPNPDDEEPTGPVPLILVSAVGRTDQGRRRKHNEDAFALAEDHGVFAIADGMGGYAAGEVASKMAIDTITSAYAKQDFGGTPIPGLPRRGDELVRAIQTANAAILNQARANEAQAGMGTTVVAARFSPNRQRVYIAHVGDSRVYRIRDHQLHQMTADHTLGAAGVTGPSAAKLSRAVGVFDEVEVDLNVDEPRVGDYYLLCSDGLFKMVPENDIQRLIEGEKDLDVTANRLVDEANARGGKDNVSVIVVRVDSPSLRS